MYHFYCRFGCLSTLVTELSTGTVKRILLIINRQDSEYNGSVKLGVKLRNALSNTLAHIIKMGSAAAYHASKYYYRIVMGEQLGCAIGEFHGSGHMVDIILYVTALKQINRPLGESFGYVSIPLGGHDGHL